MRDVDRRIAELAAQQHRVISRGQTRQLGLSRSALYRRVEGGDLIVCGTTTLRLPGPELSWYGQVTAGLLDLGPSAIVTGAAAAQLHRLDGFEDDALHYLVPREHRNRTTWGRVSSVPVIRRSDWELVDGFPCALGTQLVLDLLRHGTLEEAGNALDAGCREHLTAIPVLQRRLTELGRQGRAGVAGFEQLVKAGIVESWLERRFVELIGRSGLPVPVLQRRYRLPDVGVVRVDFEYPIWGIVVEVGGQRGYLSLEERRRKERRRNALQLEGKTIYFFTRHDVVNDPTYVVTTLATALGTEAATRNSHCNDSA